MVGEHHERLAVSGGRKLLLFEPTPMLPLAEAAN